MPIEYLSGQADVDIPIYAPFNYAPASAREKELHSTTNPNPNPGEFLTGRLVSTMAWQPAKRDPATGKMKPGAMITLSDWGLDVSRFPTEEQLAASSGGTMEERESAIQAALREIPGWLGRVKPVLPRELRRYNDRLLDMDVQEKRAHVASLLPSARELAAMDPEGRRRALLRAAQGYDGTLGGAAHRHRAYVSRVNWKEDLMLEEGEGEGVGGAGGGLQRCNGKVRL